MKKVKFRARLLFFVAALFMAGSSWGQSGVSEHNYLAGKTGKWSVVMTLQPEAGLPAQVVEGITAERTMIGAYCMHEVMYPAAGAKMPDFKRLADLAWNVNEQRWDYMSIDSRITAGIMYFTYQGNENNAITSFINCFPNQGFGPENKGRGQALHVRNVIVRIDNDHDLIKQYWRQTDKAEWLAVQYDYTRSRP